MSWTITVNGEVKSSTVETIAELLAAEGIDPAAQFLAVAINGDVVPRSKWLAAKIRPGDAVEIVTPAPGG
ncbi:MAG: thiamine biosynthesis protein ThiS [Rickettsiales bacterium]|jgi:sulfur carrier protein|nr:thiamine biosynthesis protein ThiS [Rickettsiales bacterium]|tara:strand:- start:2973 stop:3182 length:210 start_codon:yes stop_codon:yes gene_type:complete